MDTRAIHLQWCKDRALEYLNKGMVSEGMASFISDMNKHEATGVTMKNGISVPIIMNAILSNDAETCIKCVEGFN